MTDIAVLRVKAGRQPITIVELDLDFCQNTYGVPPCMAAVGVTGAQKCFNTFKTCQDPDHYAKGTKTYRFCSEGPLTPVGEQLIPCITDLDIAPTQVSPEGFSVSATVTVTMKDFPHHDRGCDPYVASRSYNPQTQGTFFGRFRGRNPYLVNRVMRVNTGYVDAGGSLSTMTRTYFIDRMEGPDANGIVKLYGKDVLRFADAEKAMVPKTSSGKLAVDMTATATSLTVTPAGSGADYPASGIVRLEDELVSYSGRSGDTLTGLVRASFGTEAQDHKANTTAQLCVRYNAQSVPAILYDLLTKYAGIPASYITMADWVAEANTWLPGFLSPSVILSKPTGVKAIYEELLQSTGCALWWDDEAAQIRFKVIVPFLPNGTVPMLNEADHVLAGSLKVSDREGDRLSRVLLYLNQISAIGDQKPENFRTVYVDVSTTGEAANAYGVPAQRQIVSRWVPDLAQAAKVTSRLLARYEETPRQVSFRLDAKDMMKVGSLFDLRSRLIQGADGLPQVTRFFVTEAREITAGTHYEYAGLQVSRSGGGQGSLIAPDNLQSWTAQSANSQRRYMSISSDAGFMSDLKPGPKIA